MAKQKAPSVCHHSLIQNPPYLFRYRSASRPIFCSFLLRYTGKQRQGRHQPNRSFRVRPPADNAVKNPAPTAPVHHKLTRHREDDIYRARHRPSPHISDIFYPASALPRSWYTKCGDAPVSVRHAHQAAPG